jgi:epoxyqueuosine reductase
MPAVNDAGTMTMRVLARCRELGFALAGVCEARPTSRAAALERWLAAGRHGEMAYLARRAAVMVDPRRLLGGARSIICVADRYQRGPRAGDVADSAAGEAARRGRIARYARGDDYHVVMKKRLHALADELRQAFPAEEFRACVDTAPILEREHAQRAGLGAVGKHTLLIEPGVGSWLLLGELVTTLALEPSQSKVDTDPCGSCTRCIDACPTGAITPWSVDATRCISYLTIEHRGVIDENLHEAMGDWVFGCDICQEVCPHNQPTVRTMDASTHEAYEWRRESFDLLELLGWDEAAQRAALRRSAMKRANLAMLKRNAVIAAGNERGGMPPPLRAGVAAMMESGDAQPVVRDAAAKVLARAARNEG